MNSNLQSIRRKILETLMDNENGLTFTELWDKVGGDKEDVLNIINDLIETPLVIMRDEKYFLGVK